MRIEDEYTEIEDLTSEEYLRLKAEQEAREREGIERTIQEEEAKEAKKRSTQLLAHLSTSSFGVTIEGILSYSKTEREIWIFRHDERSHSLNLIVYSKESRPSTRHRWRASQRWDRLSNRWKSKTILPAPPPDLVSIVVDTFISELKVITEA